MDNHEARQLLIESKVLVDPSDHRSYAEIAQALGFAALPDTEQPNCDIIKSND